MHHISSVTIETVLSLCSCIQSGIKIKVLKDQDTLIDLSVYLLWEMIAVLEYPGSVRDVFY